MDLENPNFRQNSICAIGVLLVRDNEVVERKYSLINPEDSFDYMNIKITSITPDMVVDSPTLPEYWSEIGELLTGNIVVGHNITYDLRVISKSLQRYDIKIPKFDYCCTLALSRKYLNLPSYKLENIAKNLNIEYIPHNAIEDAKASYEVFEHINNTSNIDSNYIHPYLYQPTVKEKYDPKLSNNLNTLKGIMFGFTYKDMITPYEIELLNNWFKENKIYRDYLIFDKICSKLENIFKKEFITKYDLKELNQIVPTITESSIYKKKTLKIQILQGIINAITCDNKITFDELIHLKEWLLDNNSLNKSYPCENISAKVDEILEKGCLTNEEQEQLALYFKDLFNPIKTTDKSLTFEEKTYCLSGDFKHGNKDEIHSILEKRGLIKKSNVSSKVDYLFVGDLGSPGWKYGNIGGKIIQAQKLKDKGCSIQIISEKNLFEEINKK